MANNTLLDFKHLVILKSKLRMILVEQDQKLYYLILKSKCLFRKTAKHKADYQLIQILSENNVKKKINIGCEEKNDLELLRLVTGDSSELQALEAKYNRNCYNLCLKKDEGSSTSTEGCVFGCGCALSAFKVLIGEIVEPAPNEARALKVYNILINYKDLLRKKS